MSTEADRDAMFRDRLAHMDKAARIASFPLYVQFYEFPKSFLAVGSLVTISIFDAALYSTVGQMSREVAMSNPVFWATVGTMASGTAGLLMAVGGLSHRFYTRFYQGFFDIKS